MTSYIRVNGQLDQYVDQILPIIRTLPGAYEMWHVGSSFTGYDTMWPGDRDYLVATNCADLDGYRRLLNELGWTLPNPDEADYPFGEWLTAKKELNLLIYPGPPNTWICNLILMPNEEDREVFLRATALCKRLGLGSKDDRIATFAACGWGQADRVPILREEIEGYP